MNKPTRFRTGTLVLFIVLALVLGACQRAEVPQTGGEANQVSFEMTDTAITVPEQVPAGIVTVMVQNNGTDGRSLILGRLNEGVTIEQFTSSFLENPDNAATLVSLVGGRGIRPGESDQYTVDIDEGTYAAIGFPESDAPPTVATFQVVASGSAPAGEPASDGQVDLVDFTFSLPTDIRSGQQTWEIQNAGQQWHELYMVKLNPGVTQEDLMNMMMSEQEPSGPPPWEDVLWFGPLSAGRHAWVTVDLEPGTYTVMCFLPDLSTGESHIEKGMIQTFEITE